MTNTSSHTIGELAVAMPEAIPILERLGIDYCCHGEQRVQAACSAAGITADELLQLIGTVQNPIRMMMLEHETVGEKLIELRGLTIDYELPEEACTSYKALFAKLIELEADLHQHIHLENNILFPRALDLEERSQKSATVG